jgi:hypothetical protein
VASRHRGCPVTQGWTLPDEDCYFKDIDEKTGEEIVNEMYLEHREDNEKTQLQKFFLEEMQRICPQWVQVYDSTRAACSSLPLPKSSASSRMS